MELNTIQPWVARELPGFPGSSCGRESACNAGDPSSITGLGRSPGEGNGNPLQYSCLENSINRGAWQTTVHGVAESYMTARLSLSAIKKCESSPFTTT